MIKGSDISIAFSARVVEKADCLRGKIPTQ